MKKAIGIIVFTLSLLFTGTLFFTITKANAQGAINPNLTLTFNPKDGAHTVGEEFTTSMTVGAGQNTITKGKLQVIFSQDQLADNEISFIPSSEVTVTSAAHVVTNVIPSSFFQPSQTVKMLVFDVSMANKSGSFNVGQIKIKPHAPGYLNLSFGDTRLYAQNPDQYLTINLLNSTSFAITGTALPTIGQPATATVTPTPRPSPCNNLGDVNNDGFVTENDALEVMKYIAGTVTPTPEQLRRANVDGISGLNMNDVLEIRRYIAQGGTFAGCTTPTLCDPDPTGTSLGKLDLQDLAVIRDELLGNVATNKGSCLNTAPDNTSSSPTNLSALGHMRDILLGNLNLAPPGQN